MNIERYRAAWAKNAIAKQQLDDQEKLVGQIEGMTAPLWASTQNWKRQDVDWQAGGGRRIKGIHHPKDSPVPTLEQRQAQKTSTAKERIAIAAAEDELLVESPPVDGFVPWIAVSITKQRGETWRWRPSSRRPSEAATPTGVNAQTRLYYRALRYRSQRPRHRLRRRHAGRRLQGTGHFEHGDGQRRDRIGGCLHQLSVGRVHRRARRRRPAIRSPSINPA